MLSPYFVKRFLYISFKLLHTKRKQKEQAYGGRKKRRD